MKLITYGDNGGARPGVLLSDDRGILDIGRVMPDAGTLMTLIEMGDEGMAALARHAASPPAGARLCRRTPKPSGLP